MMPALTILFCWLLSTLGGNFSRRRIPGAPSISVSPSWRVLEGSDITIHCESPYPWGVKFYLWKGSQNTSFVAEMDGGKAYFSINPVNRDDRGLYSCSYYHSLSRSYSEHSDPLELLMRDAELPRPTIATMPSSVAHLGDHIIIHCSVKRPSDKVYLVMAGHDMKPLLMEPKHYSALFSIQDVRKEHEGSYYCCYRPQSEFFISEPSNSVNLLVLAPQISMRPSNIAQLGSPITIQCSIEVRNTKLYLHKVGSLIRFKALNSNEKMAEFSISELRWEHRGSYCCSLSQEVPTSLDACTVAELLITDPKMPRPEISVEPAENISLGAIVHLHCKTQERALRFYFQKSGEWIIPQFTKASRARITINTASKNPGGNYSCSYQTESEESFLSSELSDPVELLIRDPHLPRPRISIYPSRSVALGAEVKILCETTDGPMRFYLHQAGITTGRWPMKLNFDISEFSIHNVSQEHEGKYSCSYAYLERPFVFSNFSDPVELLISDQKSGLLIGVCIAVVFLLPLLFGVIFWYKRRRDDEPESVSKHSSGEFRMLKPRKAANPGCYSTDQEIPMENLSLESSPHTKPKSVIYAELKQKSLDIQEEEELDDGSEGCVYTAVVHRTRNQDGRNLH